MEKYLQLNAFDVEAFEDQHLKDEMKKILLANGWIPRETITSTQVDSGPEVQVGLSGMKTKLKNALMKRVGPSVASHLGVKSPGINELEFKTSNDALAYGLKFPRPPVSQLPFEQSLLEYERIDDYSR